MQTNRFYDSISLIPKNGMARSLLPIVLTADNFPVSSSNEPFPLSNPQTGEIYTPFHLTLSDYQNHLPHVGLLRQSVLDELKADKRSVSACPWGFHITPASEEGETYVEVACVFFADWVVNGGKEVMHKVMQEEVERWREEGKFSGALLGEQSWLFFLRDSLELRLIGGQDGETSCTWSMHHLGAQH